MGDDPSAVRAALYESLGVLLDLDFDNLLFVHGEPPSAAAGCAARVRLARMSRACESRCARNARDSR